MLLNSLSIVVVDDEPIIGKVISKHLVEAGFVTPHYLEDPREAMDWIRQFRPDVILLDIFMPYLSGLELLTSIRAESELDDSIVLMLSSAGEEERYQALEMGAMGFIQKPTTPDELKQYIERTINVVRRIRTI